MIKFIKLTETVKNGTQVKVLINPAHIAAVKIGLQGRDTHVSMGDGKYFFVKESVEVIERMLAP